MKKTMRKALCWVTSWGGPHPPPPPDTIAGLPRLCYWQAGPRDWRWHLKATNGEILAQGEGYVAKAGVQRGIDTVRHAMALADIQERV